MNVIDVLQFVIKEGMSVEDIMLKPRDLTCTNEQAKVVRPGKILVKRKPKVSRSST